MKVNEMHRIQWFGRERERDRIENPKYFYYLPLICIGVSVLRWFCYVLLLLLFLLFLYIYYVYFSSSFLFIFFFCSCCFHFPLSAAILYICFHFYRLLCVCTLFLKFLSSITCHSCTTNSKPLIVFRQYIPPFTIYLLLLVCFVVAVRLYL